MTNNDNNDNNDNNTTSPPPVPVPPAKDEEDVFTVRIMREARDALAAEPELCALLRQTVLAPWVETFEDAVTATVCYRLLLQNPTAHSSSQGMVCPHALKEIVQQALAADATAFTEHGHSLRQAVRMDAQAVMDRDPACATLLEVVLFYKGFAALVVHRVAHYKWHQSLRGGGSTSIQRRSMTALFLQSQASSVFGVDLHPAATIGGGVLLDHGTGIVVGETAVIGDGCTLLHGVTLGGTGKDSGDRHPKLGRDVLIGAGASVLGNIKVGDRAKIGAGSIVLRPIPAGATAVGAPAKIIGKTIEASPAATRDETLSEVGHFRKSVSNLTLDETATNSTTSSSSSDSVATLPEEEEAEAASGENNNKLPRTLDATFNNSNSADSDSGVCPYREYTKFACKMAGAIPAAACRGVVTLQQFHDYLSQLGCPPSEIMPTFFALDQHNVGYLRRKEMTPAIVAKALGESTTLDDHQIASFVQCVQQA